MYVFWDTVEQKQHRQGWEKKKSGKGTGARKGTNMRLHGQYRRGKLNLRVAKKIASDVRKENFNFSRVCRSDYLETRSTAELKGQNHVSGWESKTNSALHKAPLLEIASGVQQPSVGEERDCTVNEISSLSRSALAVAFPMNWSSCLGCLEVNRTASPW